MYRNSIQHPENESDDDLPFEMEPWVEHDEDDSNSRPGNPIPKILNDNFENGIDNDAALCVDRSAGGCQKRVRVDSLADLMTSSGERWQFQNSYLFRSAKCQATTHRNLFSESYLFPVTTPAPDSIANFNTPPCITDGVVKDFRDMTFDRSREAKLRMNTPPLHEITDREKESHSPGYRVSKKSRVCIDGITREDSNQDTRDYYGSPFYKLDMS